MTPEEEQAYKDRIRALEEATRRRCSWAGCSRSSDRADGLCWQHRDMQARRDAAVSVSHQAEEGS